MTSIITVIVLLLPKQSTAPLEEKTWNDCTILTFGIVIEGETNLLEGAMETAVNLMDLNRGPRILPQSLTILPDILIWCTTKP